MNSPMYDTFLILTIVSGYFIAAALWLIMAAANIKWRTKNAFAGLGMVGIWLMFAYRNYHFFTTAGNVINEDDAQLNYLGVLFVDCVSFYLASPYFKHLKNYIGRLIK